MSVTIELPALGDGVEEATIGRWLKRVGEAVDVDEPLLEVITDKVNVEIPSPAAGQILQILAEEGSDVPVGTPIAIIGDVRDVAADTAFETTSRASGTSGASAASGTSGTEGAPSARASATTDDRPRTTPRVREMAIAHGIDLATVAGSGLGGRVTATDVEVAATRSRKAGRVE